MNKLKIQEEVDKRATAILQDLNMIAVEFKSHGLPIRVDTTGIFDKFINSLISFSASTQPPPTKTKGLLVIYKELIY